MILGNGIDIIEIERIKNILNKNEYFLNKIFTEAEREYIITRNKSANTVAGLFAAKEAVCKALGTGLRGFKWKDIEIKHTQYGKPQLHLNGKARELAQKKGVHKIHITITHNNTNATAYAVAEGKVHNSYNFLNKFSQKPISTSKFISKKANIINESLVKEIIPKRKDKSHKGDYGRAGIIAGSLGMTGAAFLACQSALRSGSGLVYSIIPQSLALIMSIKLTEVIIKPVKDDNKGHFTKSSVNYIKKIINQMDTIALGCGLGVNEDTIQMVEEILSYTNNPVVLDADGLNCISHNTDVLKNRQGDTIITPHPGELSRLLNVSIDEIQNNRVKYAKIASQRFGVITVLKGHNTIISDVKGKIFINSTGNSGMATAGSGDVLTGIITGFIGQGFGVVNSSIAGVFIHGLAGDLAAQNKGKYAMIATDIIEGLPYTIKLWEE